MKRVMKFVKQNIIGFVLGLVLMGVGVVTAANIVPATGVTYSNDSSSVTNVNEALDELFSMTANHGYTIDTLYDVYQYSALYSSGTIAVLDVTDYNTLAISAITFTQSNNMKVRISLDGNSYGVYGVTTSNIEIDVTNVKKVSFILEQGVSSSERITITGVSVF